MVCPYCGRELKEDAKFCEGCGTNLENVKSNISPIVNNTPSNRNKKGKTIGIIVATIIVIVVVIIGIILTSGENNNSSSDSNNNDENESSNSEISNKENNSELKNNETKEEKINRQISNLTDELYCGLEDPYKRCILYVTNNNKETVNVVLNEIYFKDENGKSVGLASTVRYSNGLGSGETGYIIPDIYYAGEYASYETKYSLQTDFESTDVRNEIEISATDNKEKKQIDIVAKNNSKETIDGISAFIFFYRGDKLIAVGRSRPSHYEDGSNVPIKPTGQLIIKSGETVYDSINYPYGILDFDRIEIKVGEAYSSKKVER